MSALALHRARQGLLEVELCGPISLDLSFDRTKIRSTVGMDLARRRTGEQFLQPLNGPDESLGPREQERGRPSEKGHIQDGMKLNQRCRALELSVDGPDTIHVSCADRVSEAVSPLDGRVAGFLDRGQQFRPSELAPLLLQSERAMGDPDRDRDCGQRACSLRPPGEMIVALQPGEDVHKAELRPQGGYSATGLAA